MQDEGFHVYSMNLCHFDGVCLLFSQKESGTQICICA
jgi:hypothetical protein